MINYVKILEEHRKNCEQQGKYVEAEIAKNRLDELKSHEEKRRMEAMRARQISDMLGVEEAHMLEFKQFNLTWDKKMTEYENQADRYVLLTILAYFFYTKMNMISQEYHNTYSS